MFTPDTAAKLAKLIPLLASDKDGEVVATVHAIRRTLKSEGSDLHGLAAAIGSRRLLRPRQSSDGRFSYADEFKEASPTFEGPAHPDAMTTRFGLPLYAPNRIEPWPEVAKHCLQLNRATPARYGGKFLLPFQIDILKSIRDHRRIPTNRLVSWIETVIARCHQARDAHNRAQEAGGNG